MLSGRYTYMGEAKGNGTMAATLAGYAGSYQTLSSVACDLLKNPNIQRAMEQVAEDDPLIATRCDRQRFWTKVMGDGGAEMRDRLKASELLGKTQADFVERREVVGSAAVEHRHQHRCEVDLSKATDEELAMLERTIRRLSS
jgi:phage terminase small subunit